MIRMMIRYWGNGWEGREECRIDLKSPAIQGRGEIESQGEENTAVSRNGHLSDDNIGLIQDEVN